LVKDIRKEMDGIRLKMSSSRGGARTSLRGEFKALRKELRFREKGAVLAALKSADVVLGTLTTVGPEGPVGLLADAHFDACVIDEAGQALEVACWTALLRAPRCILAGDHLQLPPTITSREAAAAGLATTLLERAIELTEPEGYVAPRVLAMPSFSPFQVWMFEADNVCGVSIVVYINIFMY
jgi:ATP-dependent RNA/DNA helicase IGHMBP2